MTNIPNLDELIRMALLEDVGDGDHSTLACIPPTATNTAKMVAKAEGIVCGMEVGERVFHFVNDSYYHSQIPITVTMHKQDGDAVKKGDILMTIEGASGVILTAERTALNFMQRLSGIATETHKMVAMLDGLNTRLLDTRKTTPNMRLLEKYAVKCGGGTNHRIGLYDMVMLKDNHIDFAGGIEAAIDRTRAYLKAKGKDLRIEIEVRNMDELEQVMQHGRETHWREVRDRSQRRHHGRDTAQLCRDGSGLHLRGSPHPPHQKHGHFVGKEISHSPQ